MKSSRKKNPQELPKPELEEKTVPKMKFQHLPEEIEMYLVEIYPFGGKLFLTGVMTNGQTLNIVANDLFREIYFVLKDENDGEPMSTAYLAKAEQ